MLVVALAGLAMGGGVWGYAGAAQMHRNFEGSYLRHEATDLQRANDVEKILAKHPPNERALLSNLWAARVGVHLESHPENRLRKCNAFLNAAATVCKGFREGKVLEHVLTPGRSRAATFKPQNLARSSVS
jgi:hypothetical protein